MTFLRNYTIQKRFFMLLVLILLGFVFLSSISLSQVYKSLLQQKYSANQQVVETAFSVISYFHQQQNDGILNEIQAKKQAIDVIKAMRYDQENYFWINDFTPTMLMHPIKPKLDGKNIASVKDPDGTALFVDMVNIVNDKGEGFVPYKWPKPRVDDPVDKISFVKGFKPWQWIIGSGTYIDDIDAIFATQRNTLLAYATILMTFIILLGYFIGKSIIIPTHEASNLMKDIAQGDGDLTRVLDHKARDEISRLAHYFNEFTKKMRESLREVSNNSQLVLNHAQSVADSSESAQILTQSQNDITTQIARATEQQTQAADEVNLRINDLANMANDSLSTSDKLNDASLQLKSSSHSMSKVVSHFKF